MKSNMEKRIIPIVFAIDDKYAPFLSVTLSSIIGNNKNNSFFKFYVLYTDLDEKLRERFSFYNTDCSSIEFVDVSSFMKDKANKMCIRDYYTATTYYRFFICSILKDYDKAIYLDSDMVLTSDISELYDVDLKDNVFAVVPDESVQVVDIFHEYTLHYLGIPGTEYFNAGMLVINLKAFKENKIYERFIDFLNKGITFEVAQDQDYLNVLSFGKVKFLNKQWNKMPLPDPSFDNKTLKLIHFNHGFKPWLTDGVLYEEFFWKYANYSPFIKEIKDIRKTYDEKAKAAETEYSGNLMRLAIEKTELAKQGKIERNFVNNAV